MSTEILVPYDYSTAATRALEWAAEWQRGNGGFSIHVIYVINPAPVAAPEVVSEMLTPEDLAQLEVLLAQQVRKLGVVATVEIVSAPSAPHAIVETAERRKSGLIAMGTHGREGIARLVLGSVAEHAVRHAPCPVVTVRAGVSTSARAA